MSHYQAVSRQFRTVLDSFTPVVEPISIDEAFLDVSGLEGEALFGPPEAIGRRIKEAVRAAVGLTASVGIGPNRLVAKVASDYRKPDGLVVVAPEEVLGFLGPQPVGVLRGVGPRPLPILERLGLRTVADLRALSVAELQRHLGPRAAASLYQQARGIAGRAVVLKIRFAGFETHTRQQRLDHRSDDARTLFAVAWALYLVSRWDGRPVRQIGLGIGDLGVPDVAQPDLFESAPQAPADGERARRLATALDRIEARFGAGALRRGFQCGGRETEGD
jgi:DNA polymerase-4